MAPAVGTSPRSLPHSSSAARCLDFLLSEAFAGKLQCDGYFAYPLTIKTDERGRVRTPAERRESLLDEFERSGLGGPKFAALSGIKYQTFAAWVCQRRWRRGVSAAATVKPADRACWLEAVMEPAQNSAVMVLHLPGGVRVEQKQAALAVVLVRALAQSC